MFRPARPNYAPVFLGTTVIISVTGDNYDATDQTAEITLTLDPIFYFWNPYNREVEVDNLMVHFDVGLSGTVNIEVTDRRNAQPPTRRISGSCCHATSSTTMGVVVIRTTVF